MVVEIPEGHTHVRTTIRLVDGTEWTLQEAAVSNLLRAFTAVKTHPVTRRVELRAQECAGRKEGYAAWQLLETDSSTPEKNNT